MELRILPFKAYSVVSPKRLTASDIRDGAWNTTISFANLDGI